MHSAHDDDSDVVGYSPSRPAYSRQTVVLDSREASPTIPMENVGYFAHNNIRFFHARIALSNCRGMKPSSMLNLLRKELEF